MTDAAEHKLRGWPTDSRQRLHVWTEEDLDLRRVAVARGAVVLIGLVVFLAWPDRGPDTTAAILGAIAIAVAVTSYVTRRASSKERTLARSTVSARAVVLVGGGTVLIVWPQATTHVMGLLVGVVLTISGIGGILRSVRHPTPATSSMAFWRGAALIAAGALAMAVPEGTIDVLLLGLVIAWAADAVIALVAVPSEGDRPVAPVLANGLQQLLERFPMEEDQRAAVTEKLFYEGSKARDRLWRFGLLMMLSTSIAALGIIEDSTAVVIGAMLISPLMTPIMGAAAALVSASPGRILGALLTVAGGVGVAVVTAWLVTGLLASESDPILDSAQITSRVSPTLIDLLIALAAGAAGAFAISRSDVSDSLPGAAIAVALVPPLAVVGIALRIGEFEDVVGASLLFTVNLVGMILAGSIVFLVSGYPPIEQLRAQQAEVAKSLLIVSVAMLLVALPLALTGRQLRLQLGEENDAQAVVHEWAKGQDLDVFELTVDGSEVSVVVTGASQPDDVKQLGAQLEGVLGGGVALDLTYIETVALNYPGGG
ncbi:MAG: DUF389 domain-containing protein [Ilumatobacteraceae bacterium]|nr:DUF389 domain-containing protein [Ilumatobacteraceae bacterium]